MFSCHTKLRAWLVLRNFIHVIFYRTTPFSHLDATMYFYQLFPSCYWLQVIKLYARLTFLCRLVRAAHAKGANIILIQVCIVGTCDINFCSIWLLQKHYFLESMYLTHLLKYSIISVSLFLWLLYASSKYIFLFNYKMSSPFSNH